MDLQRRKIQYNVNLEAAEKIEIFINDNSVFLETVPADFKAYINLSYDQSKV